MCVCCVLLRCEKKKKKKKEYTQQMDWPALPKRVAWKATGSENDPIELKADVDGAVHHAAEPVTRTPGRSAGEMLCAMPAAAAPASTR